MFVSGRKYLYLEKELVFGQSGFIRAKVVVFELNLIIRAKVVVFRQKWLYSG